MIEWMRTSPDEKSRNGNMNSSGGAAPQNSFRGSRLLLSALFIGFCFVWRLFLQQTRKERWHKGFLGFARSWQSHTHFKTGIYSAASHCDLDRHTDVDTSAFACSSHTDLQPLGGTHNLMQALQQPANICLQVLPLVAGRTRSKQQIKVYVFIWIKKVKRFTAKINKQYSKC